MSLKDKFLIKTESTQKLIQINEENQKKKEENENEIEYNLNVDAFNIVPEVFETVLYSLHLSCLFCSSAIISTILSFSSLICSSASVIMQFISSRVFLISVIVLFISVYSLVLLVCGRGGSHSVTSNSLVPHGL